MKQQNHRVRNFFLSIKYCLTLSWKTSRFYTVVRMISGLIPTILTIAAAYAGKYILNILSGTWKIAEPFQALLFLLILVMVTQIVKSVTRELSQYCQIMHDDMMNSHMSLFMMEKALHVDLECFDNVEYHDSFTWASQNSRVITTITWNTISLIESAVSFVCVFAILCSVNWGYGVLMAMAAFPASVAAVRYTKTLYLLNETQINGERKKSYLQGISLQKEYAAALRLYDAGGLLRERYQRLWKQLFEDRREKTKQKSILTGVLNCLPEIMVAGISIHIAYRVLNGELTVGDYSFYTGLIGQLWSSAYMLSMAVMNICDDQLKIDGFRVGEI